MKLFDLPAVRSLDLASFSCQSCHFAEEGCTWYNRFLSTHKAVKSWKIWNTLPKCAGRILALSSCINGLLLYSFMCVVTTTFSNRSDFRLNLRNHGLPLLFYDKGSYPKTINSSPGTSNFFISSLFIMLFHIFYAASSFACRPTSQIIKYEMYWFEKLECELHKQFQNISPARVDDLPFGLENNETWFPLFLYMLLGWLSFSWYTVHIWASHLLCGYLFIRWLL